MLYTDPTEEFKMANERVLQTSIEALTEVKDSRHLVLSPAVGYYSAQPRQGSFLTAGSFIGRIKVLNTSYDLHLPEGVYGRVVSDEEQDFVVPVEYGQMLFRLNPDENLAGLETPTARSETRKEAGTLSEEGFVVTAFTTGIFYAKPSPDSPPFVAEGQEIEKGKAMGLIEVMKTFNHIIFHGTDNADTGKIKRVLVKDSQEVKQGQPLFLIE